MAPSMARIAPEPSAAHPGVAPVIALSPSSIEDVQAWKTRPLDRVYQIVYFDAMFVRVREDRSVRARACYLAVGVTCDGEREVLGIWWQETLRARSSGLPP